MTDDAPKQDHDSGLVARTWTRTSRRRGEMAEQPLEGKPVEAAWIDPAAGDMRRSAGTVRRNDAGKLVIESWAEGVRQETEVPRDASVDVIGRG